MDSAKKPAKAAKEKTIGSIVSHPLRSRCLLRLAERTASPAELAHELRKPLSDVSYHVATLLNAGAIELVGERPVRGSVEHFYRAIRIPYVNTEETAEMSLEERLEFSRQIFQLAVADATVAFAAQVFNARPSSATMRFPFTIDENGWNEVSELFTEMESRIYEIRAKSDGRRAERPEGSEVDDVRMTAFISFFERPER